MNKSTKAKNLIRTRDDGFSILNQFKNWKSGFRFICLILCAFLYYQGVPSWAVGFCAGYMVGLMLEDFLWFKEIKKSWPFTESVIDWGKVEKLADEKDS